MHRKNKIKVILCGGGTGGHIFPMISIANELKNENKENEILFVGSRDRMEMEIVPKHNFKIIGLWMSGCSLWFTTGHCHTQWAAV